VFAGTWWVTGLVVAPSATAFATAAGHRRLDSTDHGARWIFALLQLLIHDHQRSVLLALTRRPGLSFWRYAQPGGSGFCVAVRGRAGTQQLALGGWIPSAGIRSSSALTAVLLGVYRADSICWYRSTPIAAGHSQTRTNRLLARWPAC